MDYWDADRNPLALKMQWMTNHHFFLIFSLLSMPIHKFGNVFTAEPPRMQRVDVLFYPAVRGGRIKGSLSASGRDLHKAFSLEEVEAFALAASHRQGKKPFSLRPLRLGGEQIIR